MENENEFKIEIHLDDLVAWAPINNTFSHSFRQAKKTHMAQGHGCYPYWRGVLIQLGQYDGYPHDVTEGEVVPLAHLLHPNAITFSWNGVNEATIKDE